jgi:hypothetical protein
MQDLSFGTLNRSDCSLHLPLELHWSQGECIPLTIVLKNHKYLYSPHLFRSLKYFWIFPLWASMTHFPPSLPTCSDSFSFFFIFYIMYLLPKWHCLSRLQMCVIFYVAVWMPGVFQKIWWVSNSDLHFTLSPELKTDMIIKLKNHVNHKFSV